MDTAIIRDPAIHLVKKFCLARGSHKIDGLELHRLSVVLRRTYSEVCAGLLKLQTALYSFDNKFHGVKLASAQPLSFQYKILSNTPVL